MNEPSWTWVADRVIPSVNADGHALIMEIVDQLKKHGWTDSNIFGVHLSLEEAVVNAIKHGNRESPEKRVHVSCKISPTRCWIEVRDEGPGFNPEAVPDCTLDENLDKPSGRGLMLMRNFMTMVNYLPPGNHLVMEKVLD